MPPRRSARGRRGKASTEPVPKPKPDQPEDPDQPEKPDQPEEPDLPDLPDQPEIVDIQLPPPPPREEPTTKRRKRTQPYSFTEQQEQELAEWYRDQEMLYNRRIKEYKEVVRKKALLTSKGESYDPPCTCEYLFP